jgi:magnesium transporter
MVGFASLTALLLMALLRLGLLHYNTQEEVAFVFRKYNLASAPVVDDAGRLTGVLTMVCEP